MSKSVDVDLHTKFNKDTEVELKTNLAGLIQLFNAVNFVVNHKVEFLSEANPCEECFDSLLEFLEYMDGLIESAENHYREEHLN